MDGLFRIKILYIDVYTGDNIVTENMFYCSYNVIAAGFYTEINTKRHRAVLLKK